MKTYLKVLALSLALLMLIGVFAACKKNSDDPNNDPSNPGNNTPLVVGYSPFSSKFSPFFAETAYDQDVYAMTQISLLTSDRTGAIIKKGIEGETIAYNGKNYTYYGPANLTITENADGTVYYDFVLREDLKFSDGTPVTIDDVIFSMYVLSDPTYDGSSTLYALPIEGMEAYRKGYFTLQSVILATNKTGYVENNRFTEEQYNYFWKSLDAAGVKFAQSIADFVLENYKDEVQEKYGNTEFSSLAKMWGYENVNNAEEFWAAMVETYGYNLSDEGINKEIATDSITTFLNAELGERTAEFTEWKSTGEAAPNISGIRKTGTYSMRVVLTEVDAVAIYQLGVSIAPLHYYGSRDLYNYDNNQFGFTKGDLSSVRARTTTPMGAGPYKFIEFKNGVVRFERNESYFLGSPKIRYINFQECLTEDDKINGLITGTIDITDPTFNKDTVAKISEANGLKDGKLIIGDKLYTNTVANLGYGYIGLSAVAMNVNGNPGSEESKALRKAFATILAVYRDLSVDSYYGELASVINYPISDTSWAAPRPSDDDYSVAFSKDVNGNPIYTSGMTAEQKYAAAKEAALGFFRKAGYTVENGKVTAAPAGAKLAYEALIPGGGSGDHPSFQMLQEASKALAEIGVTLYVSDITNANDLWNGLESGTVAIWCAAWGATVDPDMYQIYYSDVANHNQLTNPTGKNPFGGPAQGGSNYTYGIADAELDRLILAARATTDQDYRKSMYKECLDRIIDWSVELPVYQRQNAVVFAAQKVNMATVTPDITTFYGWMAEIQNMELK